MRKVHETMMAGAYAYAQADKSDPFAYARAVSHINNGVATPGSSYGAERYMEMRTMPITGEKYQVEAYKNVVRP